MPLSINALGGGHTHILMHKQEQFQEAKCMLACGQWPPGLISMKRMFNLDSVHH